MLRKRQLDLEVTSSFESQATNIKKSAAVAHELLEQAEQLKTTIDKFTT
ncbi:hypothetical protein [Alteribacillus sp. HJP-4]